ncbi:YrhA family protein [Terribacillus saccharophilus]|uniref:SMI1 / KNR4 family protein n=1 Tax=Terribacillus saccharophilus TaxID=361277 RepID=A0A268AG48_9BACI|nr:YrhA family protein [Terribacillus saccharophilus]PAD23107.1 SMI1 / KNR4 family protein [Terribacillus saccharophilus]
MSNWLELLNSIQSIESNHGETLRRAASDEEIAALKNEAIRQLDANTLPHSYITFLKQVNGLDFNGLVIYGVDDYLLTNASDELDGFISTNEIWRENKEQKQYIFFADSSIAWYCLDLISNTYVELDKPSGTVMETYDEFDSLLYISIQSVI